MVVFHFILYYIWLRYLQNYYECNTTLNLVFHLHVTRKLVYIERKNRYHKSKIFYFDFCNWSDELKTEYYHKVNNIVYDSVSLIIIS